MPDVNDNSAPVVSTTPAEEVATSDVNWSDMALEMDTADGDSDVAVEGDNEVVAAPENAEPQSTEAPANTPSPAPVAQPAEPTSLNPQDQVAGTPPTQPTPVPAQAQTPPSQEPPAQPSKTYADWRTEQLGTLEKHYAMGEEAATQLLTEPENVLPKLAAQLHIEITEHVLRSVMSQMPTWVEGILQSRTRESDAEKLFTDANPDLKDPAYKNAILQMGMAYRQLNPNSPAEEAVKVIGNMVRTSLGLAVPAAQSGVPVTPAAPAPAVQPQVFTPARGGGGAAVPTSSQSNPWSAMAEEFLDD